MSIPHAIDARWAAARPTAGVMGVPLVVLLLVVSLLVPTELSFYVGPLRLTAYRVILLATIIPCAGAVLFGPADARKPTDWLMAFFAVWGIVALSAVHDPFLGLQSGGINALESLGAYLIGRRYIRDAAAFFGLARLLAITVMLLAIFTVPEAVTGRHVIHNVAGLFGPGDFHPDIEKRMGLFRAFGPFEHPILYGVFCASAVSMSWFVLCADDALRPGRVLRTLVVIVASAVSVSSGPMAAIVVQLILIAYERLTRWLTRRWTVLAGLLALIYVFIGAFSNRTPMRVMLSYLTFSPETAYGRMVIWDKGSDAVLAHPIFGCGFNDWWDHPSWMSSSMDNFWLVLAYQFGLPAGLAFAAGALWLVIAVGRRPLVSDMMVRYRFGWMFSMLGLSIAGCTVHFWNSVYVVFCFLLGAGAWLLDHPDEPAENAYDHSAAR